MACCGKSPQSMTGGPADRKFNLPVANALLDGGTLPLQTSPPATDLPPRALAVFTKVHVLWSSSPKVRKRPPCFPYLLFHVATWQDCRPCHC